MPTLLNYPKIRIIRPQGCLNATNACEFKQDLTSALIQDDITLVLVDLELVESLDGSALMVLVSALKLAGRLGRSFRLVSISPSVKIILELTQLDQVFEIEAPNQCYR